MGPEQYQSVDLSINLEEGSGFSEMTEAQHADVADVSFFESQLNTKPDAMSADIVQGANLVSDSLEQKKHEFESALAKASNTANPADVLAAARSLSEYSIQTSIVAKAAGKSSQAIDKITNLQ